MGGWSHQNEIEYTLLNERRHVEEDARAGIALRWEKNGLHLAYAVEGKKRADAKKQNMHFSRPIVRVIYTLLAIVSSCTHAINLHLVSPCVNTANYSYHLANALFEDSFANLSHPNKSGAHAT